MQVGTRISLKPSVCKTGDDPAMVELEETNAPVRLLQSAYDEAGTSISFLY